MTKNDVNYNALTETFAAYEKLRDFLSLGVDVLIKEDPESQTEMGLVDEVIDAFTDSDMCDDDWYDLDIEEQLDYISDLYDQYFPELNN